VAALIDDAETLERGLADLARLDPVMGRLVSGGARPALRRREPGFAALAWIVVSQQLSTASADAIWARVKARFPDAEASAFAAASDEELRAAGLSAPKIRTLRALAAAVLEESLPLDSLHEHEADLAHALLTAVKGVGPWTADIYLLSSLGHADAFPAGDLALQEAARLAYGLDARPTEKDLRSMAERWRPWRGVAARVLWAHYRLVKSREGAPV
jgi:DNA-3-methyladenine glycosylase II